MICFGKRFLRENKEIYSVTAIVQFGDLFQVDQLLEIAIVL